MGVQPAAVSTVPLHARPELLENSVAVMSRSQPGVFYSMNDSDNEPLVFALDTTGHDRGLWRVTNAIEHRLGIRVARPVRRSRSARRRASTSATPATTTSVYPTRAIYRAAEPSAAQSAGFNGRVRRREVDVRLPDGAARRRSDVRRAERRHDPHREVSAARPRRPPSPRAGVSPAGERVGFDRPGESPSSPTACRSSPARRRSASSPTRRSRPTRDTWPCARTNRSSCYATDSATGRVDHSIAPAICNIVSLGEAQGEGISWADDRGRFVFTSEGGASPLMIATCPLPSRSLSACAELGLGAAGLGARGGTVLRGPVHYCRHCPAIVPRLRSGQSHPLASLESANDRRRARWPASRSPPRQPPRPQRGEPSAEDLGASAVAREPIVQRDHASSNRRTAMIWPTWYDV